jgi:Ca2+-binding EF-hand superfamily protein
VDEDNSGSIDFDEFLTMMKKKMMENDRRSEDVKAAFAVFDQVNSLKQYLIQNNRYIILCLVSLPKINPI